MSTPYTFLDLFCGCGGFSLGLERAGLKCLGAVDFNHEAIEVFRANFKKVPHALEKDLTAFSPLELAALIGADQVDLIVGGPPCQGFSSARQVDGANHGDRLKDDPRRHLYKEFLRYVEHFQPKVFVIENVLGIRSASGGIYFSKVQAEARALGYKVHAQIEDCVNLGVPQKRRRQLFIGTREEIPKYFHPELKPAKRAMTGTTLWDAISDLPSLKAGEGQEIRDYDITRRVKAVNTERTSNYLFNVLEVKKADQLTAHRARPHSDRDLRDFLLLKEGESSAEAMRRGVEFEFPYDKTSFKDRYTRQHRQRPCSTIVAHLAKDGLMFIHPTQNRTLTPREAARIQSFPDWFELPVARTHQFRVIGNAVPPLVGEAVGDAVVKYLKSLAAKPNRVASTLVSLPDSDVQAATWIVSVAKLSPKELRQLPLKELKRAWYSIAFLYMGLHPDGDLEHGTKILNDKEDNPMVRRIEPRLLNPYYEQSGWPVLLENIANEAWRRYEAGQFADDEFYCSDAQMAGACFRDPEFANAVEKSRKMTA
ncbi:MAG: DNA (cytosine-5-)-methyltransferase [Verrucomicrobiales bacterium VVV1]|nr:MAG: DNA (cytosine-5-)-methyltransferase [Verrucomicrobiales bacterium VVV1]